MRLDMLRGLKLSAAVAFVGATLWLGNIGFCQTNLSYSVFVSQAGDISRFQKIEGRTPDFVTGTIDDAVTALEKSAACDKGAKREIVIADGPLRLTKAVLLDGARLGDCGLVIRSLKGARARVTGAVILDRWTAPTRQLDELASVARGHVVQIDLTQQAPESCNPMGSRGLYWPLTPVAIDVFEHGKRLQNARWPQIGYASLVLGTVNRKSGQFVIPQDRANKWVDEHAMRGEGYWSFDYSFEDHAVEMVDKEKGLLQLKAPDKKYGLIAGQRYFLSNVFAELGQPGEWYLDPQACALYVWPLDDQTDGIEISRADAAFLITNAKNITLQDFDIDMTRGDAVVLKTSSDVTLRNLGIRNIGTRGVVIDGGNRNHVELSHLEYLGAGGVSVTGGDRASLTPAGHTIADNTFHKTSELLRTGFVAAYLDGVGQIVSGNTFIDLPDTAIKYLGNDHQITNNTFRDTVQETSDAGIVYTGRDWTSRGTVISGNIFLGGRAASEQATRGVYVDDQSGGQEITNNVFICVKDAVFIGGGSDNKVTGNLFVRTSPLSIDARGQTWQKFTFDPASASRSTLQKRLHEVPYDSDLYKQRYPGLAHILDARGKPYGNYVADNLVASTRKASFYNGAETTNHIEPFNEIPLNSVWAGSGDICETLWSGGDLPLDAMRKLVSH